MNSYMVLTRGETLALLDALLPTHSILAPVVRDGITGFDWIETAAEVRFLKGGIPTISAKKGLLPRTEVLFYFARKGKEETLVSAPPPRPQVIFGLHPCDVRAVRVLDTVFTAPPQPDGPYLTRRQVTTLIGLGTVPQEVPSQTFFEALGISCLDNSDCDLFLVPLPDDRFLLEVLTTQGAQLVQNLKCKRTPTEEDLKFVAELRKQAANRVSSQYTSAEFRERVEKLFDAPLWEELSEKCIACGVCAFVCPTCHCFDIQDVVKAHMGCRIRRWDTCQFEAFTLHASGHNPRPGQKQRARQRVFHKFVYGERNFQIPFCVGCGRCSAKCPMRNDLLQLLERIRESPAT